MGKNKSTKTAEKGEVEKKMKKNETDNTITNNENEIAINEQEISNGQVISEIRSMFENFKLSIQGEVEELKKSVNYISSKFDSFYQDLSQIQEELKAAQKEIKDLKYENDNLYYEIKEIQQYSRRDNVIIFGIPEARSEKIYEVVNQISDSIGALNLVNDVSVAHRLPSGSPGKVRPIVIRFSKRCSRDAWLQCYKVESKKEGDGPGIPLQRLPNHAGLGRFTAADHLTVATRDLLRKTRDIAKMKGYKFVWTKDCNIFVRENESSPVSKINSVSDLERL